MRVIEMITAFSDIATTVIEDAKMPEQIWDSGKRTSTTLNDIKQKYDSSYLNMPALVAGGGDQFIDEATEKLQLVQLGFTVLKDPAGVFGSIWNSVTTLDSSKVAKLFKDISGATEYEEGGDRAYHQGGKHAMMASMIFFSGVMKDLGTGTKLVKESGKQITEVQKLLPSGNPIDPVTQVFQNAAVSKKLVKWPVEDKAITKNIISGQEELVVVAKVGSGAEHYVTKAMKDLDEVADKNLLDKIYRLDITALKKLDDDLLANPALKTYLKANPGSAKAWEKFLDDGLPPAFRRNITNLNQRTILDEWAGNIATASNKRKGNFGEIGADLDLNAKNYESLQQRIDGIDSPGHDGLDGAYKKNGEYFIVEGKYSGSANLNPANPATNLPKQMTDDWISQNDWQRLREAVGTDAADDIIATRL